MSGHAPPSARPPRGRHYLRSRAFADNLVRDACVRPGELVLDLGAGGGLVTRSLRDAGARVLAVELDTAAAAVLRRRFAADAGVEIREADAALLDPPAEPFAVVANLPFAAGTAILRRLLGDPRVSLTRLDAIVEWGLAAKRTAVWPSTLLGCTWGAWYELELVRRVPRTCFAPPPSVDAAVLRAVRRAEPLVPATDAAAYRSLLARAFAAPTPLDRFLPRRLVHGLGRDLGFDPHARARDLDAAHWAALHAALRAGRPGRRGLRPSGPLQSSAHATPLTRSSEAGKESDEYARPRPGSPVNATEVTGKPLLDAAALSRTLSRIAHEIIEANPDLKDVALVGIQTRGVPLARRLARLVEERAGTAPELGAVDITFYRDDVTVRGGEAPLAPQPVVRATQLDFALEGRTIVLVDDVLYTGRTIRAAIEALFDYGRPARVQLAVLVDRGHRELPIRPDYVGKNLPTARGERIQVQLVEVDEVDAVLLVSTPEEETRS